MGLREEKKLQTRRTIEAAAFDLFDQRGFDGTTLAEIAQRARIAPRTFFAYFPGKEDVVFAHFPGLYADLEQRLRDRGEAEVLTIFEHWVSDILHGKARDPDPHALARARLVAETPALAARERWMFGRIEELLARHLAEEFGDGRRDPRPGLVSAAALGMIATLRPEGVGGAAAVAERERLRQAFAFLRGGCAALGGRDPTQVV